MSGNKLPAHFLKKPLCTGDLLPARKIIIEKPVHGIQQTPNEAWECMK